MANPLSRRGLLGKTALGATASMLGGIRPLMETILADSPENGAYRGPSFLPPACRAIPYGIGGFVENLKRHAPPRGCPAEPGGEKISRRAMDPAFGRGG